MLYQQLAIAAATRPPVPVAVIGAGMFGSGIVRQAAYVPAMRVCAVADPDLDAARKALQLGGIPPERIIRCESEQEARAAIEGGHCAITANADIIFNQPVAVVVEATGVPELGARHACLAIAAGKHVAMVTKEADAAVGPMLKYHADRADVVYTAVDGDQHGMLTGLVCWARTIGMDVLCGGKALDGELILDGRNASIGHYSHHIPLTPEQMAHFQPRPATGASARMVGGRAEALGGHGCAKPWDLVELTIAANSTGLVPDIPQTHCPACWTTEIPEILCPQAMGGVLAGSGRVDAVQVVRAGHEASLGGGVFIVVRVLGDAMREMVQNKGMICHRQGHSALLMLPHHLLGVEAVGSILAAGLLRVPTGALEYLPRFDVIYRATQDLSSDSVIGGDHSPELTAEIVPATRLTPDSPLPAGLARGNRLLGNVARGAAITAGMVQRPPHSILWNLRAEMEQRFLAP